MEVVKAIEVVETIDPILSYAVLSILQVCFFDFLS